MIHKKKYLIFSFLMMLAISAMGCDKKTTIEFEEVESLNAGCFIDPALQEKEFIVTSDAEYADFKNFVLANNQLCTEVQFPIIDFNTRMLLGKYAEGGGCTVYFDREVYIEDSKLIYDIKTQEIGACKKLGTSMNFITVPKLPAGYDVYIEVS
ncbi:hypothetical protein JW868_03860 [Candidatus Woesearchaeota archaeon]|nr:hypothetical protein [Candidatus Woesearchaeota archaeon]